MLTLGKRKPTNSDLFRVPFAGPVSWIDLIEMYPQVEQEMDGECRENCLLFYYEMNPVTKVYEFKDEDAELDFSSVLQIDMNITREGESKEEMEDRKSKSCNDLNVFMDIPSLPKHKSCDNMVDINYKQLKADIKKAKKERRQQKLLEREQV